MYWKLVGNRKEAIRRIGRWAITAGQVHVLDAWLTPERIQVFEAKRSGNWEVTRRELKQTTGGVATAQDVIVDRATETLAAAEALSS